MTLQFPKTPYRKPPNPKKEPAYLKWLSTQACVCCGAVSDSNVGHHLLRQVERGMGMKAADRYAVPICFTHHSALHLSGSETVFLEERGISDPVALADEYYNRWFGRFKKDEIEPFETP